ncbi:MAG: SCO6745 family protein [Acidimicrobiales bacterium]
MTTTSEHPGIHSPELARKMWRTLEPYHGIVYFTPHAEIAYAKLGIEGRDGYFASRSAPLGAASAELVISTFYNFHPGLVRHAIPATWEKASPEAILAARLSAADAALREILGEAITGDEVTEAAMLAERAARNASIVGRPLFAAHATLPWPEEPHLALWHAITLLREFRGDGHIAALVVEEIDGCEALITHGGANADGISLDVLRRSRAWPEAEWAAAGRRLKERGLFDGERLTAEGSSLRDRVESMTDSAATQAWSVISAEEAERLRALVRPWSRAIAESGVFGLR